METAVSPNIPRALVNLPGGNDHPVVELPYTAVIDGRQFHGRGLSLVAAYVAGLMDPALLNATRIVRLVFQFNGFSVTLVVDAEVRESARGPGEAELIFLRPTGPHLQQLRHILNAFIAGDLVGLGQTIGVAGTAAPKGRKGSDTPESQFSPRRIVGVAGILLLSLGLLAIAGNLAYQRLFVTLVPNLGTVVSTGEVMRATATGQIAFLDLTAGKGEVVVAIQSPSGDIQSLFLPCDCAVIAGDLREGSTVLVGEPILHLANDADKRLVEVPIPAAMLFDLVGADRIELAFPSGAKVSAVVESYSAPSEKTAANRAAELVLLRPGVTLHTDMIGNPVEVRILHDAGSRFAWVNSAVSAASSLFGGDKQ